MVNWSAIAIIGQSVLLLYLLALAVDANNKLVAVSAAVAVLQVESINQEVQESWSQDSLDAYQVRSIIREELDAFNGKTASTRSTRQEPAYLPVRSSADDINDAQMELERIVNTGQINQREFDKVQMKFVQLDADTRRIMFRELAQAINSGDVRLTIN